MDHLTSESAVWRHKPNSPCNRGEPRITTLDEFDTAPSIFRPPVHLPGFGGELPQYQVLEPYNSRRLADLKAAINVIFEGHITHQEGTYEVWFDDELHRVSVDGTCDCAQEDCLYKEAIRLLCTEARLEILEKEPNHNRLGSPIEEPGSSPAQTRPLPARPPRAGPRCRRHDNNAPTPLLVA